MIKVDGTTIKLTRGDTETLQATPKDAEGNPYVLQDGEYIEFCLKKNPDDSETLIRKTSTDGNFSFQRSDTWELGGRYSYNFRIENGSSTFRTFIEGMFVVTDVVDDA